MAQTEKRTEQEFDDLKEVFDYLSSSATPELAGGRQQYEQGETIYELGQLDCRVYRLDSGLLVQSKSPSEADQIAYNFVKPDDIFSTYRPSQDAVEQPCETEALLTSDVVYASRPAFKEVLMDNSDLCLEMMDDLTDELQQGDGLLGLQTTNGTHEKIVSVLKRLAPLAPDTDKGKRIDFLEQKQLAEMLGLAEETVGRQMKSLERQGKIERQKGSNNSYDFIIKDKALPQRE